MSNSLALPSESVEYVRVRIRSLADPTGVAVEFAFPAASSDPSTWVAGAWEGATEQIGDYYFTTARILVGSGTSFALAEGVFDAWVRVAAVPETPARKFARLTIT